MVRIAASARSLVVLLAMVVLASAACTAIAQSVPPACREERSVEATATVYGAADETIGVEAAIARALRDAVAQVNGIHVEHLATLASTTSTTTSGGELDVRVEERFEDRIETSVAGFVAGYRVISRSSEPGSESVTLRARVCVDPRLLLSVRGAPDDTSKFVAALLPHLERSGWTVVLDTDPTDERERIAALLRHGAIVHLEVALRVSPQPSHRGVQYALAIVDNTFTDLRSRELRSAISLQFEGSGAQATQAAENALTEAATRTGARLALRESLVAQPSLVVHVRGVTRDHTRLELLAAVTASAGDGAVTADQWNRDEAALRIEMTTTMPECDVARAIERQRQLLIRTLTCGHGTVEMKVDRE